MVKLERTLVLIKPDAVQRCLVGEVISRWERKGLKIVGLKMLQMDRTLAEQHYVAHKGEPFFEGLVEFITSGPLIATVLEGEEAIEVVRRMMGETDPIQASPGTIRGDFGLDIGHNLIHGSDSKENAAREIDLFFSEHELLPYQRGVDEWVY
jgi:nucleoside-diphosphate kinase